ncbi:hypothetical protein F5Y19DRAFT_440645 [Xylariaceae sp. FL1651]|nr:hypothetical protein F5Y19DRAFT_440645 [Xylariaceae sp. FL1651]
MEAVAALGLAANVVQFVDYTYKLIQTYNRLGYDAAQSGNEYNERVTIHLLPIANKVKVSAQAVARSATAVPAEQKALQPVADGCCELANNLLQRLTTYSLRPGQKDSRVRRARIALKILWEKSEVEEMVKQLEYLRGELYLHLTFEVWQLQQENQAKQSSKDDVRAVLEKASQLEESLKELRLDLDNESRNRQAEVLRAVANLKVENSILHADATHQILASQTAVGNSIDSLKQVVQAQHAESTDSLARVMVQDSKFFATIRTEREALESSVGHVMRSLFEEYQYSLLEEIRKEYRGTARAEVQSILADLEHSISLRNFQTDRDQLDYTSKSHDESKSSDTKSMQLQTGEASHELENRPRSRKPEVSVVYQRTHISMARLGIFALHIKQSVLYQPGQSALTVYNLEAQFRPSPCWLSTGCSITYQKVSDGRGTPKFGFQFPTYRIISLNHEVWNTIADGKLDIIQTMLLKKTILPSDQNIHGWTLLHEAVAQGRLDICKALIQSGADVNAQDERGLSPLAFAIVPSNFGRASPVFYFLQGLSAVSMECLWCNDRLVLVYFNSFRSLTEETNDPEVVSEIMTSSLFASQAAQIDLVIKPFHEVSFLASLVWLFSIFNFNKYNWGRTTLHDSRHIYEYSDNKFYDLAQRMFDVIITQAPGYKSLEIDLKGLMPCLSWILAYVLIQGRIWGVLSPEPCPQNSIFYRGYYAYSKLVPRFKFLEHVISTVIKQQPGLIFDTFMGRTVCDWLRDSYFPRVWEPLWVPILKGFGIDPVHDWFQGCVFKRVWEGILEEHNIDPAWALEENERRRRAVAGNTSAHEISVVVDVSTIQEVTRRKAYKSTEED